MLVKIKYANILNFAAKEEIIPELIQSACNSRNIFKSVSSFIENPDKIEKQIQKTQSILSKFKSSVSSSEKASKALLKYL